MGQRVTGRKRKDQILRAKIPVFQIRVLLAGGVGHAGQSDFFL